MLIQPALQRLISRTPAASQLLRCAGWGSLTPGCCHLLPPAGHATGELAAGTAQGIQITGLPLADQQLTRPTALQKSLQTPAGRHRAEPQQLAGGQIGALCGQNKVVTSHLLQAGDTPQPAEGIGQHGPARAALELAQGIHKAVPLLGAAAPGAGHDQRGLVRIQQGRHRPIPRGKRRPWIGAGQRCRRLHKLLSQHLQHRRIPMQGFLQRQVQLHGAGGLTGIAQAGRHGRRAELNQGRGRHGVQSGRVRQALPAQGIPQECLLIHRLIGTTALEPGRAIRREQQQGTRPEIRLHRRWQQVGHGRA